MNLRSQSITISAYQFSANFRLAPSKKIWRGQSQAYTQPLTMYDADWLVKMPFQQPNCERDWKQAMVLVKFHIGSFWWLNAIVSSMFLLWLINVILICWSCIINQPMESRLMVPHTRALGFSRTVCSSIFLPQSANE